MTASQHLRFVCAPPPQAAVGDVYPPVRTIYNHGKTTDEALTQMAFFGIGAHRVTREHLPTTPDGEASGDWVVRTNFLAPLPVRDGLDSYGGDCYFDYDTWRVKKIVRARPTARAFDAVQEDVYLPGQPGWEYAKFVFRSTLFSLVTLVDHLYGVHMQIGNSVTVAAREELPADHPVRRFLVPYSFQTITVNDNARNNLINPRSMGPRCFAFTDQGTALAWAAAPRLVTSGEDLRHTFRQHPQELFGLKIDFELYLETLRRYGADTPYRQQALLFWRINKRFVTAYLRHFYAQPADLARDEEMRRFVVASFERLETADVARVLELAPDAFWGLSVNLLTRFICLVTAGHEQVGTVPVYAQDVSFAAFAWPKGETCGTKQVAITSATLMAFTSTPMPMLLANPGSDDKLGSDGDWTHLFAGPLALCGQAVGESGVVPPALRDAWLGYQIELERMSAECDAFNQAALAPEAKFPNCFGLWQTNPKYLETAVSV